MTVRQVGGDGRAESAAGAMKKSYFKLLTVI
jgi:hypothetical protein